MALYIFKGAHAFFNAQISPPRLHAQGGSVVNDQINRELNQSFSE